MIDSFIGGTNRKPAIDFEFLVISLGI